MCDPVSLSIASTVVGAVGSGVNAFGQANAQNKQAKEIDIWQRKQERFRDLENQRQEGMRQRAAAAQQEGVAKMSADEQTRRQEAEAARLVPLLEGETVPLTQETGGSPVSVADKSLSGQSGGDPEFTTDLAKKIGEAMTGARERIGNLAKVSSYGSSFGGLGTENPLIQQAAGSAIDQQNEYRRGSLGAFGIERTIEPVQVTYQPSPLGDIFSDVLAFGAQGMGNQFGGGGGITGSTFPKAPIAKKWFGAPKPLPSQYANTGGLF